MVDSLHGGLQSFLPIEFQTRVYSSTLISDRANLCNQWDTVEIKKGDLEV